MSFMPFMVKLLLPVKLPTRSHPKPPNVTKPQPYEPTMKFSGISNKVLGCAIEVHRTLGPGLLESTYQQCLAREFQLNHITFKLECPLPVEYKGIQLDCGYRIDILVEDEIILELKAVESIKAIHEAQLLTYLKLSGIKQGFLLNFNVNMMKEGIKNLVM